MVTVACVDRIEAENERLHIALEEIIQSCDLDDEADKAEPGSRPRDCYVISSDLIERARKALTGK